MHRGQVIGLVCKAVALPVCHAETITACTACGARGVVGAGDDLVSFTSAVEARHAAVSHLTGGATACEGLAGGVRHAGVVDGLCSAPLFA